MRMLKKGWVYMTVNLYRESKWGESKWELEKRRRGMGGSCQEARGNRRMEGIDKAPITAIEP